MRIGVISEGNIPSRWAHSINTMKHANGFFELNNYVEILTIQSFSEFKMRLRIRNVNNFYDINNKINIRYFNENFFNFFQKYSPINFFFSRILKKFSFLERLKIPEVEISNYCKKNKFNFIYSRSYKVAFYCIQNKIPTVLETHTNLINNPHLQRLFKVSGNKYFKGIVTIHKNLAEIYSKKGIPIEKILILEDAVDLKKFDNIRVSKQKLKQFLGLPLKENIIMYCGSLYPSKGIKKIIEVSKKFDQNNLFYILGGDKKWLNYWKKFANNNKLSNVIFAGFIPNQFIPYYLKSADILILLYDLEDKNAIIDINTMSPIKLFEYMAANKPIVSVNLPTIEKIVQNNKEALLSEWNNINNIAENIQKLLEDRQLANKISLNAYFKVQNYTYTKRCQNILEKFS
ncbi:MAG: glycosyltransferase [Promethearchaeota archaeon]